MAKIETRVIPENSLLTDDVQVVRALRGALADELSAQNLYSELIECLVNSGYKPDSNIIKRLQEIMEDEMNHSGSILACIDTLDTIMGAKMEEGASGN